MALFSVSLHAQIWLSSHAEATVYTRPLMTAAGDAPIVGNLNPFPSAPQPITGVVSLRELQHPIPGKALRDAYQAQDLAHANKVAKAIAKLEEAIRIAPQYRDAHVNLGVQYARRGRTADARAELEKALEIGPPIAAIYFDLALASLGVGQPRDAEYYARKALELDPRDDGAQWALRQALTH
jgi:Tfp pilus assembly protein PilF